jgi:hypothetical protein
MNNKNLCIISILIILTSLINFNISFVFANNEFDPTGGEFGNIGNGTVPNPEIDSTRVFSENGPDIPFDPTGGEFGNTRNGQVSNTANESNTNSSSTTAGNVSYESYTNFPGVGRISSLCQLITALWYLGFAVLLTSVLGMFLWGGYIYVTAGVNAGKVNQAKEIFTNTITGLIIGLSIFIIINVINPGLLQGNCSIPSVGSGSTLGGPAGPSNIVPKPGESVFPVTYLYQGPSGGQVYGAPRDGRIHAGIDFTPCWADTTPGGVPYTRAGWEAQPVLAFRDGTVNESTTGYLGVTHADGVRTRYVHNSRNLVRVGDSVKAGQEIARVGKIDTAVAHLHFEVYINGSPVNPANILLDSSRNPDPSKVKTTGSPRSGCGGL